VDGGFFWLHIGTSHSGRGASAKVAGMSDPV
jgi:hypothetical protein